MSRDQRLLAEREASIDLRLKDVEAEMQRVSALTKPQARDLYLRKIEAEFAEIGQRKAKEIEARRGV